MTVNFIYYSFFKYYMWFAKLKIKHDDCWISPLTKKFNLVIKGVALNSYEENGKYFHSNVIYLSGKRENQDKLFLNLKKDKKVVKVIRNGNQIISLVEGKEHIFTYFDKSFFFLKPVVIKEGFEYWELGSWDKKKLTKFYNDIKKFAYVKLLKMKKGFPQVFIQQTMQNITDKQKDAFEFAKEMGYYNFPRRYSVEKLAKMKKVPRTTFQGHLRKAENKILDVMLE